MRRRPLLATMALLVGACAATPTESSADPSSAASSPAASDPAVASVSAEPSDAAGRMYPYVLDWPADRVIQDWQYAKAPWDGVARVDSGNQYTDFLLARGGRLFAFGMPTDEGPEELRDLVSAQAEEWHGCDAEPNVEEPLIGGGAEGIYGEYACGGSTVARWFGVHEGFGLFIGLIVSGSEVEDDVAEMFKSQIADLEWTN